MHSYKPQKETMIDYNLVMYIGLALIMVVFACSYILNIKKDNAI